MEIISVRVGIFLVCFSVRTGIDGLPRVGAVVTCGVRRGGSVCGLRRGVVTPADVVPRVGGVMLLNVARVCRCVRVCLG